MPGFTFGTNKIVRNYTDADVWLVIREVFVGYRKAGETETHWVTNWPPKKDGTLTTSRFKSRASLEKSIRRARRGWPAHGTKYIEVLPWREDGVYPEALSLESRMVDKVK